MINRDTSTKLSGRLLLVFALALAAGVMVGDRETSAQESKLKGRKLFETHMFTERRPHDPAECFVPYCGASQMLIAFEEIECPGRTTCTNEILVCSQFTINEKSVGDVLKFSVSVDGARISPGPTDSSTNYLFEWPATLPVGSSSSHCMTFVDAGREPGMHLYSVAAGVRDRTGDGVNFTPGFSQVIIRVYRP